jgi:site-specific DNA recombinase
MNGLGKPSVRAVVYTRKSSEEGFDQEFNSLDAQYEACTAYIASQRHEGWKLLKQRFDDGGGCQAAQWTALPLRLCWLK